MHADHLCVVMKITKSMAPLLPFKVIRDTREQKGTGWTFRATSDGVCGGTTVATLDPGDYSIAGLEHVFRVERKGSINDLIASLSTKRMKSQLERLSKYKYAYLVVEADYDELADWHIRAIAMRRRGCKVGLAKPGAAVSSLMKLHFAYPNVHIQFVGKSGQTFMRSLFKRVIEDHAKGRKKL